MAHKFIIEFERFYRVVEAGPPKPAPNAKVIASWPTKLKPRFTGIGRLHKGPSQVYRVW